MRKTFTVVVILLVTLFFGKNIIAKTVLTNKVEAITGLKMSIVDINVGILKTSIGIKRLKLFNPDGFSDRLMVDMPEVYVDYDLPAFLKGRLHLEEVRLNLKEFVVVKNITGELNLDSLKVAQLNGKAKARAFRIDSLKLKIDKAIYKDYTKNPRPFVVEYDIYIDEQYENITNPYVFMSLIVVKSITKTPIDRLANFDLGFFREGAGGILKKGQKVVHGALEAGRDVKKKTETTVEEAVGKTKDIINKVLPKLENTRK